MVIRNFLSGVKLPPGFKYQSEARLWLSFFSLFTCNHSKMLDQRPKWIHPKVSFASGQKRTCNISAQTKKISLFWPVRSLPLGEYYNIQGRNPTFSFLLFRLSNTLSNIVQCSRIIAIGMALNQMHDRIFKLVTHPSKLH